MLNKDTDIDHIKHEVLYEVAKLAFAGELEEKKEDLPFVLIPGPQANFRCCIYKEREIIRQRVRIAEGRTSTSDNNSNIVQVITSACDGCPIVRFSVTDNCRKCVGKRCKSACNFNAITMSSDRAHIDPANCKECGKCAAACPYNAIADIMRPCKRSCPVDAISMDENNIVVINEEKCISCGACIKSCPFGAISDRSFIVDVIRLLQQKDIEVYAMVAPAWEGQFGDTINFKSLAKGLEDIGFTDVYEVSLGADLVSLSEGKEWAHAYSQGEKLTTSCCPAFVSMIKKHYKELIPNISTTISPMTATAKLIKAQHPLAVCVFIGPCIAKKGEVLDSLSLHGADYALTLEELTIMLEAKNVKLEPAEETIQQGTIYGKRFCESGGVSASVLEALKELEEPADIKVKQCNGALECKKALTLLKLGKLPEDFMEGMACEGGCKEGPGNVLTGRIADMKRTKLFNLADDRGLLENTSSYDELNIIMHR